MRSEIGITPQEAIAAIRNFQNSLDRTQFDLEAFTASFSGQDLEAIAGGLREAIATQVYCGILRGAEGTLVVGAGNFWDLAILVTAVFSRNDFETRYMRAALSDHDVRQCNNARGLVWQNPVFED